MNLSLNSITRDAFKYNTSNSRSELVALGRGLLNDFAANTKNSIRKEKGEQLYNLALAGKYREANEKFHKDHLLYCAKVACASTGETAPESFEDFKQQGARFRSNRAFYQVLQGFYQEVITPMLPSVYSEAMDELAEVYEVGFGETQQVTVTSNDIPIFQDSSWGAYRGVTDNTFYSKDFYLNPQPKTAEISFKWTQLVANGTDFGQFFANIVAGMYAKTMGMWNQALQTAVSNTAYVSSNLQVTFSNPNWVKLADLVGNMNGMPYGGVTAYGSASALAKVLPLAATGSAATNVDAALATLLGPEYLRNGRLGTFMGVDLYPLRNAVSPLGVNTAPSLILPEDKVYMLANSGRKPMAIAYNSATPISIEIDPTQTMDGTIHMNLTIALDIVAIFANKIGVVTV